MVQICATHIKGHGGAHKNLPKQLPGLKEYVPELDGCFCGSLNLFIDRPLRIINRDVITNLIVWDRPPGERFDLTKIKLDTLDDSADLPGYHGDAWIIGPHDSPHRKNPYIAEVLVPQIRDHDRRVYQITLLKPVLITAGVVM